MVAVFSLEELGKAEILFKRGIEAATTGPKSKNDVMAGANNHPTKLRAGRGKATDCETAVLDSNGVENRSLVPRGGLRLATSCATFSGDSPRIRRVTRIVSGINAGG